MLQHLCWRTAACGAADLVECGLSLMWNEVGGLEGVFQVVPDKLGGIDLSRPRWI